MHRVRIGDGTRISKFFDNPPTLSTSPPIFLCDKRSNHTGHHGDHLNFVARVTCNTQSG